MFLVNVQEAFGIHPNDALEMSYTLLVAMLQEYSFMWKDRNRKDDNGDDDHGEFEWIELPSWDDPSKTVKVKKYDDVGPFIK